MDNINSMTTLRGITAGLRLAAQGGCGSGWSVLPMVTADAMMTLRDTTAG